MTVYALAQLTIHDRALYGRYQSRFMEVLKRYRGRLLAADESPAVVEGTWEREKVVLLAFADEPPIGRSRTRRIISRSPGIASPAPTPWCCW